MTPLSVVPNVSGRVDCVVLEGSSPWLVVYRAVPVLFYIEERATIMPGMSLRVVSDDTSACSYSL